MSTDSPKSLSGTPSMDPLNWDEHTQQDGEHESPVSPKFPKSPKSPKSPRTPHKATGASEIPSPLLLATELTPMTSREEESALYSDSDGASQASGRVKHKRRQSSTNRRRKSDVSDARSGRSLRSSGNSKIPQTTKIFRNLLILEESLRQQSRNQRTLRRKFTAFIAILAGLEAFSIYSLYFVVAEPSSVVKIFLQLLMLFILVTLVLFHLSGEYHRTIVIPRRFFNSTNKGLRQLNLRLVKVKTPISEYIIDFWRSLLRSVVGFVLLTLSFLGFIQRISIVNKAVVKLREIELRAQPRIGVTDVKLVLNPRAFNSEIREQWEMYRDEFWVKEGNKKTNNGDHYTSGVSAASSSSATGTSSANRTSLLSSSASNTTNVLDKSGLVEKHRKERRDRRKSKLDEPLIGSDIQTEVSSSPRSGRSPSR